MGNLRHRLTRNFNLTTFTDELHSDVGASSFVLSELLDNDIENVNGHDYFTGEDLVIRTASGGGGTLLVEDTDYTLVDENAYLTQKAVEYAGVTKTVYKKIQIINATYQSGDLYFSGKYIADDLNPVDINNVTNYCKSISGDTTIGNSVGYITYLVTTTDTVKTTVTLPDATKNTNLILKILKVSDTYAPVVIDTNSTQTINNWSYTIDGTVYQLVPIFFQNECCELISDGSNWKIINGYSPTYDIGLVYGNTGNNLQGWNTVTLSSTSGNFELFEVVQDSSSNLGIVAFINSGSDQISVIQVSPANKSTGVGSPFAAGSVTGQTSTATGTYSSFSVTNTAIFFPFMKFNLYDIKSASYFMGENLYYNVQAYASYADSYTYHIDINTTSYVNSVFGNYNSGIALRYIRPTSSSDTNISIQFIFGDVLVLPTSDGSDGSGVAVGTSAAFWFKSIIKSLN